MQLRGDEQMTRIGAAAICLLVSAGLTACSSGSNKNPTASSVPEPNATAPAGTSSAPPSERGGAGTYRYQSRDGSSATVEIPGPPNDPQIAGLRQWAKYAGSQFVNAVYIKVTLDNRGTEDLGLNGLRIVTTARRQVDALNEVELENAIPNGAIPVPQVPAFNDFTEKLDASYPPHISGGVVGDTYFVLPGVSPDQIRSVDVPDQLGAGDPVGNMVPMTRTS